MSNPLDDSLAEGKPANEVTRIPSFHVYTPEKFSSLAIFCNNYEKFCVNEKFDDEKKKVKFPHFLSGDILKFYYDNNLCEMSYEECKKCLIEVFDITRAELVTEFHNLQFRDGNDLQKFFTNKLSLARRLSMDEKTTVEYLSLSIPTYLQRFLVLQEVKTPSEWFRIVRQLTTLSGAKTASIPDRQIRENTETQEFSPVFAAASRDLERLPAPRVSHRPAEQGSSNTRMSGHQRWNYNRQLQSAGNNNNYMNRNRQDYRS